MADACTIRGVWKWQRPYGWRFVSKRGVPLRRERGPRRRTMNGKSKRI